MDVARHVERLVADAAAAVADAKAPLEPVKVISSRPSWRRGAASGPEQPGMAEPVDLSASGSIQSLAYSVPARTARSEADFLGEAPSLVLGTPRGIIAMDSHTYMLQAVALTGASVPEDFPEEMVVGPGEVLLSVLGDVGGCAHCAFGGSGCAVVCAMASGFEPRLTVVDVWRGRGHPQHGRPASPADPLSCDFSSKASVQDDARPQEGDPARCHLSIFPRGPLPEGSMLKVAGGAEAPARSKSMSKAPGLNRRKASLRNMPVTFHSKVKSSGYGATPSAQRLCQRPGALHAQRAANHRARSQTVSHGVPEQFEALKQYPVDCDPITSLQPKHRLPNNARLHAGPIFRLAYSPDGTKLATASADKTGRVLRLPLSRHQGDGTDLIGHNAGVTCVSWSSDGNMLLTSSADRSARLWSASRPDPLLSLTHTKKSHPRNGSQADSRSRENPLFNAEVRSAQFLCQDRFIVLASQNKLHVYSYKICDDPEDDINRLKNDHSYKHRGSLQSDSQAVLDVTCANQFTSHLALASGSNRSVEVFDLSAGKVARTIRDGHSRPIHSVVLNVPPNYVSHSREAYELFATAAQDGHVRLWDLRVGRCIRCFSGHSARQQACRPAFSPCLRYLSVGSEDQTVYQYNLRTATVEHRLRGGHCDVISDVAYNPLHPQMATACYDGHIRFFSHSYC
uniref:Wd repeat-containing protein 27-like n=1 Tax=Tetraselmis sp. GSL018 TaxID=582737 RepID=A0A061S725_9CHLO